MSRQFFGCADRKCKFFKWYEAPDAPAPEAAAPLATATAPEAEVVQPPSEPKCLCGLPPLRTTVKREGPNFGKPFYKCAEKKCKFFDWVLDLPAQPAAVVAGDASGAVGTAAVETPQPVAADAAVPQPASELKCRCGVPPKSLTVRKEGPNFGKAFYKCAESQCTFFEWAPETPAASASAAATDRSQPAGLALPSEKSAALASTLGSVAQDVLCRCGVPATSLTVRKEGPNSGRAFSKCAEKRCDFFQWDDAPRSAGTAPPGVDAVATPMKAAGTAGSVCYKCRQTGHFARDCPGSTAGAPAAAPRSSGCFKCGQDGHFSRDCPAASSGGKGQT